MTRTRATRLLVCAVLGFAGCTQAPPPHALEDAAQSASLASRAVQGSVEAGTSTLETDQKGQSRGEAGAK